MKTYRISWTEHHEAEVEAENEDEAYEKLVDVENFKSKYNTSYDSIEIVSGGCYRCAPKSSNASIEPCEDCRHEPN